MKNQKKKSAIDRCKFSKIMSSLLISLKIRYKKEECKNRGIKDKRKSLHFPSKEKSGGVGKVEMKVIVFNDFFFICHAYSSDQVVNVINSKDKRKEQTGEKLGRLTFTTG